MHGVRRLHRTARARLVQPDPKPSHWPPSYQPIGGGAAGCGAPPRPPAAQVIARPSVSPSTRRKTSLRWPSLSRSAPAVPRGERSTELLISNSPSHRSR